VSVARVPLSARRHSHGTVAAFLHHPFPQPPLFPSHPLPPAVHLRQLFPRLSKRLMPPRQALPPCQLHHRPCSQLQPLPLILLLSTTPIPFLPSTRPLVRLPPPVTSDAARPLPFVALNAPSPTATRSLHRSPRAVRQSFHRQSHRNSTFDVDSPVDSGVVSLRLVMYVLWLVEHWPRFRCSL
jgi:hypothetical protein